MINRACQGLSTRGRAKRAYFTRENTGVGYQLYWIDIPDARHVSTTNRVSNNQLQAMYVRLYLFRKPLGPFELVNPLLSISALSAPLSNAPTADVLGPTDVEQFLQDLARRFEVDDQIELEDVLGPVVRQLLFHPSLFRKEGLAGGDSSWRGVVGGLGALVSVKSIAIMITKMEEWIPSTANAANFEIISLMGPLCRLGVFAREWVSIRLR
jgi:hypothetical protein